MTIRPRTIKRIPGIIGKNNPAIPIKMKITPEIIRM